MGTVVPPPFPLGHLLAMVLAGSLAPEHFAGAPDLLHLEPARALPEYTKLSLATKSEFMLPNTGLTWTSFSADFNGDDHLDLLWADIGNDLILALGHGDGTFEPPQFLELFAPAFPVAADFNGDGHLDLVSGSLAGAVDVFVGAGDGTFRHQVTLDTVIHAYQPRRGQLMVGDLNRDGKLDVAVASVQNIQTQTGELAVFLGNGDATFQEVIATAGVAAWRGALGDLDGDGTLDFAGDRYSPAVVEIWLGLGDGQFTKGTTYSMSGQLPDVVQLGDLNGDAILDLMVSAELPSGAQATPLSILLGKGDGTFQPRQAFTPLTGGLVFNVGPRLCDFNGDRWPELVSVAGYASGEHHDLAVALGNEVKRDPSLGFLLQVDIASGTSGPLVLETSTNLMSWTAWATNATPADLWPVVDTTPALQQRYYRTRRAAPTSANTTEPDA